MDWKQKIEYFEKLEKEKQAKVVEKSKFWKDFSSSVKDFLKLRLLGLRFRCHISDCKNVATEPLLEEIWNDHSVKYCVNWNVPGDLVRCRCCDKWSCKDHVYHSVCQKCAEKM